MIASPWFNWSKTADISGVAELGGGAPNDGGGGGGGGAPPPGTLRDGTGGGGGGGGAAPPAPALEPPLTSFRASCASIPFLSFQCKPLG